MIEGAKGYLASVRKDAEGDDLSRAFQSIRDLFEIRFSMAGDETLAERVVTEVDAHNQADQARVISSVMAVNPPFTNAGIAARMSIYKQETGAFIKNLPRRMIERIEAKVVEGFKGGSTIGSLKKSLMEEFGIGKRRAQLIARDQVSKLNAVLTEDRQKDVGVKEYIWRTVRDERVRGNPDGLYPNAEPSHFAREGKTFSWDSPPEGGPPGQAVNCRCYAEPKIVF